MPSIICSCMGVRCQRNKNQSVSTKTPPKLPPLPPKLGLLNPEKSPPPMPFKITGKAPPNPAKIPPVPPGDKKPSKKQPLPNGVNVNGKRYKPYEELGTGQNVIQTIPRRKKLP